MMDTKQLITECQNYYGMEYTRGMGRVVMQYLDTIPDKVKAFLFAQTVKDHSSSFRALPDVATFESAIAEAWEVFYAETPTHYLPRPEYPKEGDLANEDDWAEFLDEMKTKIAPEHYNQMEALVIRMQGRRKTTEAKSKLAPDRREPYVD